MIDFVGEGDAVGSALSMVRARGTYFIVGYGGELRVPTFNLVLAEISVVGNAVGTHDDLRELVALTAAGAVSVRSRTYHSTRSPTPSTTSNTAAGCSCPDRILESQRASTAVPTDHASREETTMTTTTTTTRRMIAALPAVGAR